MARSASRTAAITIVAHQPVAGGAEAGAGARDGDRPVQRQSGAEAREDGEDQRQHERLAGGHRGGAGDHAGADDQRHLLGVDRGDDRPEPQSAGRGEALDRAHPAGKLRFAGAGPPAPERQRAEDQPGAEADARPAAGVARLGGTGEADRDQRDREGERRQRREAADEEGEAAAGAGRRQQQHHRGDDRQRAERHRDGVGDEIAEDGEHRRPYGRRARRRKRLAAGGEAAASCAGDCGGPLGDDTRSG